MKQIALQSTDLFTYTSLLKDIHQIMLHKLDPKLSVLFALMHSSLEVTVVIEEQRGE